MYTRQNYNQASSSKIVLLCSETLEINEVLSDQAGDQYIIYDKTARAVRASPMLAANALSVGIKELQAQINEERIHYLKVGRAREPILQGKLRRKLADHVSRLPSIADSPHLLRFIDRQFRGDEPVTHSDSIYAVTIPFDQDMADNSEHT